MKDKIIAKIIWNTMNFLTVGFGFALFVSVGSMITEMMVNKTHMIISAVSIIWIIAHSLFIRYLNKK
jgi:hypothetical protein